MDLILQLKQEHVQIIYLLEEIVAETKNKESSKIIPKLREFKSVLLNHLKLEDSLLYPAFEKAKNAEMNELGKSFSEEMLAISKVALKFFADFEKEEVSKLIKDQNFKAQLQGIIKVVKKRVSVEEKILFPAYQNNLVVRG
ncbi:hemerythrin domain-containing protein [Candidatus Woesearchaeota archaeon]|jgi:hemerythrin-like domain-containing protein|nr:hemerythrin domain-containing protein [Candidatus Woesearchaeota archaeon]